MYSAPASRAVVSKVTVRRMSSLALASSRACSFGTSGRPRGYSQVRTMGGPPSGESRDAKCREMENVEQGGEATTTAYSPAAHRWSRRLYTESRVRLEPALQKEGGNAVRSVKWPRKQEEDSSPKNRRRTLRDVAAAPSTWSAVRTSCGEGGCRASGGKPGGCVGKTGCGGSAGLAASAGVCAQGKLASSK
eukprot:1736057-Pleurochrysis_carterae.AAC.2